MNKISITFIFLASVLLSPIALAKSDFCKGFDVGYKSIKGDLAIVPICPIEPITPIGSNPYREGILKGQEVARRS